MTESRVAELTTLLRRRADRWTSQQTLQTPGERVDWRHVVWDRLADVAYLQAIEPTSARADWLRSEVHRLCSLDPDAWIGPSFRQRQDPPIGALETSHIALAVATVLHLCPGLLEPAELRASLADRALEPCERALQQRETGVGRLNNWYHVLLNGFGSLALILDDDARIATLPDRMRRAAAISEGDSYGESVQYWGYATLHLTHLAEMADSRGLEVPDEVLDSVVSCMPWVVQSVLSTTATNQWGPGQQVSMINFGDAGVSARPSADVLLHVARYADGPMAGVARWLFEQAYRTVEFSPTELSTFGFRSQIGWRSVTHLPHAAAALDPDAAGIPLQQGFSCGTAVLRDPTRETTVLAVKGGHGPLRGAASHRHADAGSFILGHLGEQMFADPGHCCYRLPAYSVAKSESSHSTWTIQVGDRPLPQQQLPDGFGRAPLPQPSTMLPDFGEVSVEISEAYGDPVRQARRRWLFLPPHLVLIMDEIISDEPITVESRFVIDNRDGMLDINRATEQRVVLRRNGVASKLFLLDSRTDDAPAEWALTQEWSVLHDIYDPHPNAPGQGKEGSGHNIVFTSRPGRRQRALYSIILDAEPNIRRWHLTMDDASTPEEAKLRLGFPDGSEQSLAIRY